MWLRCCSHWDFMAWQLLCRWPPLSGFAGVYCSIMIYVDTQRPFWAGLPTSLRFGGSSLLFGLLGDRLKPPVEW